MEKHDDDDDEAPIEKSKPAPSIVKKTPAPLSDSDDDDGLFKNTSKKATPRTSTVEEKTDTTNENQTGRKSIKDLAVRREIDRIFQV